MLTAERLREVLDYSPKTGVFRRGLKTCSGCNAQGYVQIMVDGKMYTGHRLAWLYVHGKWPADEIDHINRNRSDNRLTNLRECTRQENMRNVPKHKDNRSGYKGVFPNRKKWSAQICKDGRKYHLGTYSTPAEAYEAYCFAI